MRGVRRHTPIVLLALLAATLLAPAWPASSQDAPVYAWEKPALCGAQPDPALDVWITGDYVDAVNGSAPHGGGLPLNTTVGEWLVPAPDGKYGSTAFIAAASINASFNGSGFTMRVSAPGRWDAVGVLVLAPYVNVSDGANGLVWVRVDVLSYNASAGEWRLASTVHYAAYEAGTLLVGPWMMVYAPPGDAHAVQVTVMWTPEGSSSGAAAAGVIVDYAALACWPLQPTARIEHRVAEGYMLVNASLTGEAVAEYAEWRVNVSLPGPESRIAVARVVLDPPPVDGMNVSFVLDEEGNPLPAAWQNGSLEVILPWRNQTLTVVYTPWSPGALLDDVPDEPLGYAVYDWGDAAGEASLQGWQAYTAGPTRVVARDLNGDYVVRMRLYDLSSAALARIELAEPLPDGNLTVRMHLRTRYTYYWWWGYHVVYANYTGPDGTALDLIYFGTTRGYNGVAESSYQGVVYSLSIGVYVRYGESGAATIRWLYLVHNASVKPEVSVEPEPTVYNYTGPWDAPGDYLVALPWSPGLPVRITGLVGGLPADGAQYAVHPGGAVNVTLTLHGGVEVDGHRVYPAGSTVDFTVTVEGVDPGRATGISDPLDPPLPGVPVLVAAWVNGSLYNYTVLETGPGGSANGSLPLPPGPAAVTVQAYTLSGAAAVSQALAAAGDRVVVELPAVVYVARNASEAVAFEAYWEALGAPFTGQVYFNYTPGIEVDTPVDAVNGSGATTVYAGGKSGRYQLWAWKAVAGGVEFKASGSALVVVTGARIIILVDPDGPPWYVYSDITWTVYAVYDDGSPAEGTGYILVEKDHYAVYNESWGGEERNVTLEEAGHVNYLYARLVEPDGSIAENQSIIPAVQNVTVTVNGTQGGSNASAAGAYPGVELVSFEIETIQEAALKDALAALALTAVALAPFWLRRYAWWFRGAGGRILWATLVLAATMALAASRTTIPADVYIVETENGTTINPVYEENPFWTLYIIPMLASLLTITYEALRYLRTAKKRIGYW